MRRRYNQPGSSFASDRERPMFDWEEFSPRDCQETLWDVVIVGAGMGGSTLGYSLAHRGLKVLFLERGNQPTRFPQSLQEGRLKRLLGLEAPEVRLKAMGRWSRKITIMRGGQGFDFLHRWDPGREARPRSTALPWNGCAVLIFPRACMRLGAGILRRFATNGRSITMSLGDTINALRLCSMSQARVTPGIRMMIPRW